MRKKILFLIPSLQAGGSERVFSILANHLDRKKFTVTIVVLDGSTPFYKIQEDVRLIDLKTERVRQALPKIYDVIKVEKPHVVVSTLTHLNLCMALMKSFLPSDIRFIARESTILSEFHATESYPWFRNLLVKLFYRTFDVLICQSKRMAMDLKKNYYLPISKLKIINNPIDTEGALRLASEALVPAKKSAFRFVSVGRLSAEKGLNTALNTLSTLKNVDFEYQIIGEGKERAALEQQVERLGMSKNVAFLGNLQNPFGWLASADLLLLPSHFEGFPNVLLESNAVGTPAVAFACGGVSSEIIDAEKTGFVVRDGDENGFQTAIHVGCSTNFDRLYVKQQTEKRFGIAAILHQFEHIFLTI